MTSVNINGASFEYSEQGQDEPLAFKKLLIHLSVA